MKRLWVCLFALLVLACSKNEEIRIPFRQVYLELDLNFEDKELLNVNHANIYSSKNTTAIERTGFGGVIVFHTPFDNGYGSYVAYDLACPYEGANEKAILSIDPNNMQAVCPKCESRYELNYGFPTSGSISPYNLHRYTVFQQSPTKLIVQN